ncbi:hypothetical protein Rrhod_1868 [Rhodococcus rhodnii LMG 5362]|uniref:Diacylglycerol O-acyltransferase n=2 Tax=Rhodococcus rhodnii TaxID=38312 RepID=R7WS30_9NOCA|nr:hypothetical protein Rrhod_1868 [Rhodococcus rhodnii LMG 5362]
MSPQDSLFLIGESRANPLHVSAVQLFSAPEGVDADGLREMFVARLDADASDTAPLLRRRPIRSLTSFGQWAWTTDERFDVEHHVRRTALPSPGSERVLLDLCARLHALPLERDRPLWEMHLIEGLSDGRFAVYTKIHHSLTDGVGAVRLLRAALSDDPAQRDMPAPWEAGSAWNARAPRTSGFDAAAISSAVLRGARSAVGDAAGMVPALASTMTHALGETGGPVNVAAPQTIFNVSIGSARRYSARTWPLERLRLVAKLNDASINDVVLAMSSGALRAYLQERNALPDRSLVAMVPVSLSDDAAPRQGNDVGVLMCPLGTHLDDPAERLAGISACMAEGKRTLRSMSGTQILAMSALGAAPVGASLLFGHQRVVRPPFNLIISNVPGPKEPLYWNGARLDALYPMSVPVAGQGLNITSLSNDDSITFGVTACRRAMPDATMLTDHLDRELTALESV